MRSAPSVGEAYRIIANYETQMISIGLDLSSVEAAYLSMCPPLCCVVEEKYIKLRNGNTRTHLDICRNRIGRGQYICATHFRKFYGHIVTQTPPQDAHRERAVDCQACGRGVCQDGSGVLYREMCPSRSLSETAVKYFMQAAGFKRSADAAFLREVDNVCGSVNFDD